MGKTGGDLVLNSSKPAVVIELRMRRMRNRRRGKLPGRHDNFLMSVDLEMIYVNAGTRQSRQVLSPEYHRCNIIYEIYFSFNRMIISHDIFK